MHGICCISALPANGKLVHVVVAWRLHLLTKHNTSGQGLRCGRAPFRILAIHKMHTWFDWPLTHSTLEFSWFNSLVSTALSDYSVGTSNSPKNLWVLTFCRIVRLRSYCVLARTKWCMVIYRKEWSRFASYQYIASCCEKSMTKAPYQVGLVSSWKSSCKRAGRYPAVIRHNLCSSTSDEAMIFPFWRGVHS